MTEQNMVPFMERLSKKERLAICFMCSNSEHFQHEIHPGMLPFISAAKVVQHLERLEWLMQSGAGWDVKYKRICRSVLGKLADARNDGSKCVFRMWLNTKKVYKQFGRSPERGKPLPHLPKMKVTVGVKWSLPKRQWLPDKDVLVTPAVALKPIGGGNWEVSTLACYRVEVEQWLQQNCR